MNSETLRYYERRGLLAEPPRTPGGYRDYPRSTVDLRVLPASGHDQLLRGGDDVADIGVGAVVGIEALAAFD